MNFGGQFPPPRPFQEIAHQNLRDGIKSGHRCQLMMSSTGSGKTYIGMRIIREALDRGKRAMFVCDRKTLIQQTSDVARDYGLWNHGIIQADNPMMDLSRPFQIASVQTLARRGWPENMDVIVIDEAHSRHKTWIDHVQTCRAAVVGLSATPFSKGLGKIFTNLVNASTMHDLTESGVLVPMKIYSCHRPDMTGAETSGGEWTDRAAEKSQMKLIGDVVTEWVRLAFGLKTIVFGATILHCREIAKQFNDAGIKAAVFCADTPDEERKEILEDFGINAGETRVLVSVEALAKGFDDREIGAICDCRPLRKSLSTAIQMWGRGLRSSPETGKSECIILDFSGNLIRFSDDFSNIFFNGLDKLDNGEKLDKEIRKDEEKKVKKCPQCGFEPMGKRCIKCGFEPKLASDLIHEPGTMREIKLNGRILAFDEVHLYNQLATYAKLHSAPEKRRARAAHLFRDITGKWPPREFDPSSAPLVEPTIATRGKIRSLQIAFAKRRSA